MDLETQKREFAELVRQSRRAQRLTQEALAGRIGITKGALSRYESGDVRVLGEVTVRLLCEALQLVGPAWLATAAAGGGASAERAGVRLAHFYCPKPFCPLNEAFMLPGRLRFRPRWVESEAGAEVVCQWCGTEMQSQCPDCGAALVEGSTVCVACGADYVPSVPLDAAAMEVLRYSPPTVAKLNLPTARLPYWPPRPPGAAAGTAVGTVAAGRQVKSGGSSHGNGAA